MEQSLPQSYTPNADSTIIYIYKLDKKCNGIPHSVYIALFVKMVTPIPCFVVDQIYGVTNGGII